MGLYDPPFFLSAGGPWSTWPHLVFHFGGFVWNPHAADVDVPTLQAYGIASELFNQQKKTENFQRPPSSTLESFRDKETAVLADVRQTKHTLLRFCNQIGNTENTQSFI